MTLTIENPDNLNLSIFADKMIEVIKDKFDYDEAKLNPRDLYLQDYAPGYRWIQILDLALNNLYWYKSRNNFIITINHNILLYGTQYTLYSLVKLLEYGNNEFPPYPLWNPLFNKLGDELQIYYNEFIARPETQVVEE